MRSKRKTGLDDLADLSLQTVRRRTIRLDDLADLGLQRYALPGGRSRFRIVIDTSDLNVLALVALVRTGLFGTTVEICAEELLRLALRSNKVMSFLRRTT